MTPETLTPETLTPETLAPETLNHMPPTTNEPTLTHLSSEEDEPMEKLSDGAGIADESPKYDFFQERKTDLEIVKRLQASTARLNLAEVYVAPFVGLIEDIAHEQNCQTKFVSTLLPPTLATAMGPRVRVSAWHSGEHGWIEVGNAPWFLAAPSGTGKTNAARAVKKAVVQLEKTCDIRVLSTGFTNSAIKTRMHEHGQAFAILEEVRFMSLASAHCCTAAPLPPVHRPVCRHLCSAPAPHRGPSCVTRSASSPVARGRTGLRCSS